MAKRSRTFKQFLLRVHPDRFRALPDVHAENLASVQLLNQFMDEQSGSRFHRRQTVHFSAFLEASSARAEQTNEQRSLKRFSLELGASIEGRMHSILAECGVQLPPQEDHRPPERSQPREYRSKKQSNDRAWSRERSRRPQERRREDGMDFGSTIHEMYTRNRASSGSRRRKPITSLAGLLLFMQAEDTKTIQDQRVKATQSIESLKRTLQREFGLAEVSASCGWSSVNLNTTIMVLLKTLRKFKQFSGTFTPERFLHGASIDISSNPTGIDYLNEYQILINPTDVPLQWIEVFEAVDANMMQYMHSARSSLAKLQLNATEALGEATIRRGHTCPALSYRGFLQVMAHGDRVKTTEIPDKRSIVERVVLAVEERGMPWKILVNGDIQTPCDASFEEVIGTLHAMRETIRAQRTSHESDQMVFEDLADRCRHALGLKSLTCAKDVSLGSAILCCQELLKLAQMPPPMGLAHPIASYTCDQSLSIGRSFGLSHEGLFTLPYDWHRSKWEYLMEQQLRAQVVAARDDAKRYAALVVRLQQQLARYESDKRPTSSFAMSLDEKVSSSLQATDAWEAKLSQAQDNQEPIDNSDSWKQQALQFLQQQRRFLLKLSRKNAQLSDQLDTRPSRRDLAQAQLEIERLRKRLKTHSQVQRPAKDQAESEDGSQHSSVAIASVATNTFGDRITVDKLLKSLRVQSRPLFDNPRNGEDSSLSMRRRFLKEPIQCLLAIDESTFGSKSSLEIEALVGKLCCQIVASCCHAIQMHDVGSLAQCVDEVYSTVQLVPYLQDFLERLSSLVQALDQQDRSSNSKSDYAKRQLPDLDSLLTRITDAFVELEVRRDQMNPPGSRAHDILFDSMKVLHVSHIDLINPTINKLIESGRLEKRFTRDLREILGLDASATRNEILRVVSGCLERVGLANRSSNRRSRHSRNPANASFDTSSKFSLELSSLSRNSAICNSPDI